MSHENAKNLSVSPKPDWLDRETTLIVIQGEWAIQISLPNKEVALKKNNEIERVKSLYEEDDMFAFTYLLSSNYRISTQENSVIIEGPLHELEAAICRLHAYGNHISRQKADELLKEIKTREQQARQEKRKAQQDAKEKEQEKRIHAKYTQLAEKYGMDPNLIFPNPPKITTGKNLSPASTEVTVSSTSTITQKK